MVLHSSMIYPFPRCASGSKGSHSRASRATQQGTGPAQRYMMQDSKQDSKQDQGQCAILRRPTCKGLTFRRTAKAHSAAGPAQHLLTERNVHKEQIYGTRA